MSTFRLTAYLATPIALGTTYFTLDAVLFGILSDMRDLGISNADPIENIPLASINGMFLASAAEFHAPVEAGEVKIGGIRTVRDMADAVAFIAPVRGSRIAKIDTTRSHFKAHMSRYRNIAADTVSWLAEGNPLAAKRLVEQAGSIGALRKDGHGQIARVGVEEVSIASVLTTAQGGVTRPIPIALAPLLGIETSDLVTVETWRPPYWLAANRAECLVPTS
ncbi:MAG: hypothetical protein HC844_14075 [Tabrizicola sp.]|nr:hypothetical protein [Tabrizicola sp.]